MPIHFNYLLGQAGIDPKQVRLVRHQDGRTSRNKTPYHLLKSHPDEFMEYQSHQGFHKAPALGSAKYWAVFVGTPQRQTLFAGLYSVVSERAVGTDDLTPEYADDPHVVFELVLSDMLEEYRRRLTIEWGKGALSWVQYAHRQDKPVREVRLAEAELAFPGYLKLISRLSEIETFPDGWVARLSEAKGVYLLSCPATGENYVGSATGDGGFYTRWLQHAAMGGDAARFRSREASDLQVCILEVAGSSMNENEIVRAEYRWMEKLKPALNGHTTLMEPALDHAVGGAF